MIAGGSTITRRSGDFRRMTYGEMFQLFISLGALMMVMALVLGILYGMCKTACPSKLPEKLEVIAEK